MWAGFYFVLVHSEKREPTLKMTVFEKEKKKKKKEFLPQSRLKFPFILFCLLKFIFVYLPSIHHKADWVAYIFYFLYSSCSGICGLTDGRDDLSGVASS